MGNERLGMKLTKDSMESSLVKVLLCFDSSDTLEQLETSRKLMENFISLYDCCDCTQATIRTKYELKLEELKGHIV